MMMATTRRFKSIFFAAMMLATWAAGARGAEDKPLDNAEIVKLTSLEMGEGVIIAKVKGAREVNFDTSTDALVALKEAGVSKAVITAMIERQDPAVAPAVAGGGIGSPASAKVTLATAEGTFDLKPSDGEVKTIVAPFVGLRRFIGFPGVKAAVRTRDRKASVLVAWDKNPQKTWWLVVLDPDDDPEDMDRSIDVESPGAWGGVLSSAPDEDSLIRADVTEEKTGLWRIRPLKELRPGEYGVYTGKGELAATLFDFGVDK